MPNAAKKARGRKANSSRAPPKKDPPAPVSAQAANVEEQEEYGPLPPPHFLDGGADAQPNVMEVDYSCHLESDGEEEKREAGTEGEKQGAAMAEKELKANEEKNRMEVEENLAEGANKPVKKGKDDVVEEEDDDGEWQVVKKKKKTDGPGIEARKKAKEAKADEEKEKNGLLDKHGAGAEGENGQVPKPFEAHTLNNNENGQGPKPFEAQIMKEKEGDDGTPNADDESESESEEDEAEGNTYLVVQTDEEQVVTAPVGKKPENWPYFVAIPDRLVRCPTRPLQIGDLVEVKSFKWRQGYEKLASLPKSEIQKSLKPWINAGQINFQAFATDANVLIQKNPEHKTGVILEVRRDARKGDRLKCIVIAAPGLRIAQRVYRRQFLRDLKEDDVKAGAVVMVEMIEVTRPSELRVSPSYIIPDRCRFGLGMERKAHGPSVIIGVASTPISYEFPFKVTHTEANRCLGEEAMAAAISACIDKLEGDLDKHTIRACPWLASDPKERSVLIEFEQWMERKSELVERAKLFDEDQPLHVTIAVPDAKPCAHGFVQQVQRRAEDNGFVLNVKAMVSFQPAKKYDSWADFERLGEEGGLFNFRPLCSLKTLQDRMDQFDSHYFTTRSKEEDTGMVFRALLGMDVDKVHQPIEWEKVCSAHQCLQKLQAGQQETARLMLDKNERVVFSRAPPGTGKTFTATAIVAAYLAEHPKAKVLCTAPLNIAVAKLCEEMQAALQTEGLDEKMLALFSGTGKSRYRDQVSRISKHMLAEAVTAPEWKGQLDARKARICRRYVEKCVSNPKQADEGEVARILLENEDRRIFFATLSLSELIGGLFKDVEVIVVDEAGQASMIQLLAVVGAIPRLRKVLITGDPLQLRVHTQELPAAIWQDFGLDTIIVNMDSAPGVDLTRLSICFRSHSHIVRCVEAGTYRPNNELLVPGRDDSQMNMLTERTPIKLPVAGSPLILIHQNDMALQEATSFSSTNPHQTSTVLNMLQVMHPVFPGNIRVVCLYSGQAGDIGEATKANAWGDVLVDTANACQGHEADLEFVVTTQAQNQSAQAGNTGEAFWADANRINVALSRGRYGLIIIGDFIQLWSVGGVWRRFIQEALLFTEVVTPDYVRIMAGPEAYYQRGILVGPQGQSVQAYDFYKHKESFGSVHSTIKVPSDDPVRPVRDGRQRGMVFYRRQNVPPRGRSFADAVSGRARDHDGPGPSGSNSDGYRRGQ